MLERGKTIDETTKQQIVAESHNRSRMYGINPEKRDIAQPMLSPAELKARRSANDDWLNLLRPQFDEIFDLLAARDFTLFAIDADGYILHITGSEESRHESANRNCVPGFRWTERDVGTSAISLCLKHQIPIQLTDEDHYCKQAHGYTSSAAPVFGKDKELIGVIMLSGRANLVHPHTLYMTTTIARGVERELRIVRRNRELALHVGFLDQIIETSHSGMIILDSENYIWRVNKRGLQVLKQDRLIGQAVTVLKGLNLSIEDLKNEPSAWVNRECILKHGKHSAHFIYTAQLVISQDDEHLGTVITLEEMEEINRLADTIAGTKAHYTFSSLKGQSKSFTKAVDLAARAAQSSATVLLQGETGTGKELFAQAIHNEGERTNNPFVPINCGAIPAELLESELFGYVEGTFTGASKGGRPGKFELANGGTILLDEIGDMPHHMQVKLLRVLQTGEVYRIGARQPIRVDTRIIASTHVEMTKAVAQGIFREDLFYRLNVLPITIPPLRERGKEDIMGLASFFLSREKGSASQLSPQAQEALIKYSWPGNVRELENCMQRALHTCEGKTIELHHLDLPLATPDNTPWHPDTLEGIERSGILKTLDKTEFNMAETAKILQISRTTLYRKVKQYIHQGRIPSGIGPKL